MMAVFLEWLQLRDETSWGGFFLRRITRGDWKEKKPSGKLQAPERPNCWNVKMMISKFGIVLSSEKLMFRWTVSKLQGYSPLHLVHHPALPLLGFLKTSPAWTRNQILPPFFCHLDLSRAFSTGLEKPNHLHSLELTSRIYTCPQNRKGLSFKFDLCKLFSLKHLSGWNTEKKLTIYFSWRST